MDWTMFFDYKENSTISIVRMVSDFVHEARHFFSPIFFFFGFVLCIISRKSQEFDRISLEFREKKMPFNWAVVWFLSNLFLCIVFLFNKSSAFAVLLSHFRSRLRIHLQTNPREPNLSINLTNWYQLNIHFEELLR